MTEHRCIHSLIPCFLSILLVSTADIAAHGTTVYVGPGEAQATIQAGIDAAADGDIVIVRSGKYSGAGNYDIDLKGKAIKLRSEAGAGSCIIDAQQQGRGFYIHQGETGDTVISGFQVKNGKADRGAGMLISGTSPLIRNCVVTDCTATGPEFASLTMGGGIAVESGASPVIRYCTVQKNASICRGHGGGIYVADSSPTIESTRITENKGGLYGGGIYAKGSGYISLHSCEISMNIPSEDSQYWDYRDLDILWSNLTGGGVYIDSPYLIRNSHFTNNWAHTGGGVSFGPNANGAIQFSTFYENAAELSGGGIDNRNGGALTILNCSIYENSIVYRTYPPEELGDMIIGGFSAIVNTLFHGNGTGGINIYGSRKHSAITNCTFLNLGNGLINKVQDQHDVAITNCIIWDRIDFGRNLNISYSNVQGGLFGLGKGGGRKHRRRSRIR